MYVKTNQHLAGFFKLGGRAVSRASKKKTYITHSTMEYEFVALATAGKKAEWFRNLLLDIELWPQPMPAISLQCNSEATMSRHLTRYIMINLDILLNDMNALDNLFLIALSLCLCKIK